MTTIKATTIDQSDRLIELGIDSNTADLSYVQEPTVKDGDVHYLNGYDLSIMNYSSAKEIIDKYFNQFRPFADAKPAWTLDALIKVMPNKVFDESVGNGALIMYRTMNADDGCRFVYNGIVTTKVYANPIDAAIEMIEWLKTNNKLEIKKE